MTARIWTVADFARHAYGSSSVAACTRARRVLKKLDAKHGGALLLRSAGANRRYTFLPSTLQRLEERPVGELELDALEDAVDQMKADQRAIVAAVARNSRAIAGRRAA